MSHSFPTRRSSDLNLRQKYLNIIFLAIFAIIPIQANAESVSCDFVKEYINHGLPSKELVLKYGLTDSFGKAVFPFSPFNYSVKLIEMPRFSSNPTYKNEIINYLKFRKIDKFNDNNSENTFFIILLDEEETEVNLRFFIKQMQIDEIIKDVAIQKILKKENACLQTQIFDIENKKIKNAYNFIKKDTSNITNIDKICLYEGAVKAFGFNAGRDIWSPGCPNCTKIDIEVIDYLSKIKKNVNTENLVINLNNIECKR